MLERLAGIIGQQLHLAPSVVIDENTSFKGDLRADSFEIMELVMAFEDEFGIRIDDSDLESLGTVGDVIEFIKRQGIE